MSPLVVLAVALSFWPQASVQRPPRDPRPADLTQAASDEHQKTEAALRNKVASNPDRLEPRFVLAKFQEDGGDYDGAEATLLEARAAFPARVEPLTALSGFYNRIGDFEKTIAALEQAEQLQPGNREAAQRVATFYWEKAFRDHRINEAQKSAYIRAGIAATDRALAMDPDYAEAMTYKNILLRMQANMEADPAMQRQLTAQADALRARAIELQKSRAPALPPPGRVGVAPVPPPPPPVTQAPVRISGSLPTPVKIRDVKPVYPDEAQAARVQGVVIIEATIDANGFVSDARVLRSIPLLDQAALDAVRQWQYTPTLLNGVPVPVIMTVTVNFTVQ